MPVQHIQSRTLQEQTADFPAGMRVHQAAKQWADCTALELSPQFPGHEFPRMAGFVPHQRGPEAVECTACSQVFCECQTEDICGRVAKYDRRYHDGNNGVKSVSGGGRMRYGGLGGLMVKGMVKREGHQIGVE